MKIGDTVQAYGSHGWVICTLLELHPECKKAPYALVRHCVRGKFKVPLENLKAVTVTQEEGR